MRSSFSPANTALRVGRTFAPPIAALLLDRSIELDPALGEQVEKWRGRSGFIDYLGEHKWCGSPWLTVVMNELEAAMHKNDLEEFSRWLLWIPKPMLAFGLAAMASRSLPEFPHPHQTRHMSYPMYVQPMEILQSGSIESDDQLMELAQRYGQMIIPSENEDLDLTHWWILTDDGNQMLYVGTPETFSTWVKERNGGVQ